MPAVLPTPVDRPVRTRWWRLVDWRLVAAFGLPLWAFLFGLMLPRKPAVVVGEGPAVEPLVVVVPVPPPLMPDIAPMPREAGVPLPGPEVVAVPLVVPVPVPGEAVAAGEPAAPPAPAFRLPDTELVPGGDRCKTFDTKVRFHPGPAEAVEEAKKDRKMLFVLHISGNFEDPGFT